MAVRLIATNPEFFSSQDAKGRLRGVRTPDQQVSDQGSWWFESTMCKGFFFLYAVLQLSCLGKEEIWTAEREKQQQPPPKNKPPKSQTFFLSTPSPYMGIAWCRIKNGAVLRCTQTAFLPIGEDTNNIWNKLLRIPSVTSEILLSIHLIFYCFSFPCSYYQSLKGT